MTFSKVRVKSPNSANRGLAKFAQKPFNNVMDNGTQRFKLKLNEAIKLDGSSSFDGDLDYKSPQIPIKDQAAVLILVNHWQTEPSIVLTKRTQNLRHHPGQVAFPGGRKDARDPSLWAAALRETEEEIGLPPNHPIEALGELNHHLTITGYEITPFVALNGMPFDYKPEASEVDAVFEIPFSLLHTKNFEIDSQIWQGKERRYWVLPYEDYFIWGATARILHQLAARLENV